MTTDDATSDQDRPPPAPTPASESTASDGGGDLLTIDEAAEYLKVSAVTISRWRRQGRLPTLKVGPRAVRIRRADLDNVGQPYQGPLASLDDPPTTDAAPAAAPRTESLLDRFPPADRTLERAERLRGMILKRRGGDFLAPADDLGKLRDKRAKRRS